MSVLEDLRASVDVERIRRDVVALATPRGRRHAPEAMRAAQDYVAEQLRDAGWSVREHEFRLLGTKSLSGVNLLAARPRDNGGGGYNNSDGGSSDGGGGSSSDGDDGPTLLIGAHLDSVPGSPGADDNASGVACLLELARVLVDARTPYRIELAVFDEEETGLIGSYVLARDMPRLPDAMVVLECLGCVRTEANSQRLPTGARLVFPRVVSRIRRRGLRGDWTLIVYRSGSARLAASLTGFLRQRCGAESAHAARDPLDLPVLGWLLRMRSSLADQFARSDHKPFWDRGVPAVQITDTANFRNTHYHQPSDLPDTLDYERIADITATVAAVACCHQLEGSNTHG